MGEVSLNIHAYNGVQLDTIKAESLQSLTYDKDSKTLVLSFLGNDGSRFTWSLGNVSSPIFEVGNSRT